MSGPESTKHEDRFPISAVIDDEFAHQQRELDKIEKSYDEWEERLDAADGYLSVLESQLDHICGSGKTADETISELRKKYNELKAYVDEIEKNQAEEINSDSQEIVPDAETLRANLECLKEKAEKMIKDSQNILIEKNHQVLKELQNRLADQRSRK